MLDFLKGLLENASSMLGYGRGSVVRANEHGLDAKIVRHFQNIPVEVGSNVVLGH